jgi:phosphoribosyl-ATP pyrophosphohydrolase
VDARFILLQTNEEYIDFVRLKIEEKFIEVIEAGKNPRDKNKVIEEIADLREIISIAVKL